MSETKLEANSGPIAKKFRYYSENSLSKIEHCEKFVMFAKFSLCLIAKIFDFFVTFFIFFFEN